MQDSSHLQKFNHSFYLENELNTTEYKNKHSEHFDFFLVLDLEGKVEILEFPVLMIDAKTMNVVAFFHRFFIDFLGIIIYPNSFIIDLFM